MESEVAQGAEDRIITAKVVQAWKDAGLYKLLLPARLGGEGLDSVSFLQVGEEVSRQDASSGWTFAIHTVGTLFPGLILTEDAYLDLLGPDRAGIACGFAFGKVPGTARPVEGGYLVQSEPMPFGSGTQHADRVASMLFLLDEKGDNVIGDDGSPVVVNSYIDRSQIEWLHNWNPAGLHGTGSGHYRVREHVLEKKWLSLAEGDRAGDPVYAQGFFAIVHMHHCSVALGVAKRAVEEMAKSAKGRRRGEIPALDEHPLFQAEFVRVDAEYRSARALVLEAYGSIWEAATEGRVTELHTARVEQAALHLHRVLSDIVSTASLWAGSDAIPHDSAIARLNADTAVAVNHLLLSPHQATKAAPHLLEATLTDQ
ncbi:acyl-CoA dehydrogenase family protein (plasmid) [Nocardioides sp. R1-1]|uniref:acyl-CoA dehydrogenase family protein n=1 Tax=Nocardioides sp. R1-1 TaxID=3383502 RepID=UPI0038CF3503